MTTASGATALAEYCKKNPGFTTMYTAYQPDLAVIEEIQAALPAAHVVVVSEYWCGDSRRMVPRLARVIEHLPGWTVEAHPWDSATRGKPWQIRAIPTVIIFSGERELGRIVESVQNGTVEDDLLSIVSA
jgi:hypothetical protein